MQQVTVGTKYQIVIPKDVRKKIKALVPGARVAVYSKGDTALTIQTQQKTWIERTRGITKKVWKRIDTTKYLDDLRNEWDKK